ncbi:hypothetical protein MMC19_000078, partial [Ptychographa xylographoides]|nr:hypothetical protein [Ptychographa xylographoides]
MSDVGDITRDVNENEISSDEEEEGLSIYQPEALQALIEMVEKEVEEHALAERAALFQALRPYGEAAILVALGFVLYLTRNMDP